MKGSVEQHVEGVTSKEDACAFTSEKNIEKRKRVRLKEKREWKEKRA